jgi:hypothetical protein
VPARGVRSSRQVRASHTVMRARCGVRRTVFPVWCRVRALSRCARRASSLSSRVEVGTHRCEPPQLRVGSTSGESIESIPSATERQSVNTLVRLPSVVDCGIPGHHRAAVSTTTMNWSQVRAPRILALCLLFRLVNALCTGSSVFNPDEYWQSLEVAYAQVWR